MIASREKAIGLLHRPDTSASDSAESSGQRSWLSRSILNGRAVSEVATCAEHGKFARRRGTLLAGGACSVRMRTRSGSVVSGQCGRCVARTLDPHLGSRWRSLVKPGPLASPMSAVANRAVPDPRHAPTFYRRGWPRGWDRPPGWQPLQTHHDPDLQPRM